MGTSERMTWEEIRERYAGRWVVLVEQELQADDSLQLRTARVLTCAASRAEAVSRAHPAVRAFAGYGCRYTGERRGPPGEVEPAPVRAEVRAAAAETVTTGERMTWKQICARYPEQWVVMVDHDWQPQNATELGSARVLAVGSSRIEAKERARSQIDSFFEWGCHYTGPRRRGPRLGCRP